MNTIFNALHCLVTYLLKILKRFYVLRIFKWFLILKTPLALIALIIKPGFLETYPIIQSFFSSFPWFLIALDITIVTWYLFNKYKEQEKQKIEKIEKSIFEVGREPIPVSLIMLILIVIMIISKGLGDNIPLWMIVSSGSVMFSWIMWNNRVRPLAEEIYFKIKNA